MLAQLVCRGSCIVQVWLQAVQCPCLIAWLWVYVLVNNMYYNKNYFLSNCCFLFYFNCVFPATPKILAPLRRVGINMWTLWLKKICILHAKTKLVMSVTESKKQNKTKIYRVHCWGGGGGGIWSHVAARSINWCETFEMSRKITCVQNIFCLCSTLTGGWSLDWIA